MKYIKIPYYLVVFVLCCFSFNNSVGQNRDYTQDSLQIKVYTEIEYVNSQSKDIVVKKVFCDYCSENQTKFITEKAKQLAFYDRYNPSKRLINGLRKFAIIIRVSKKDFLALKDQENNKEN